MTRKLKVYIAGPYADRDRGVALLLLLEGLGYEVTSTWLRERENDATPDDRRRAANLDLADVARSDALLAWTRDCSAEPRGTLVEIGAALAADKPVVWIGRSEGECVFYDASGVLHVASTDSAIAILEELRLSAGLEEAVS